MRFGAFLRFALGPVWIRPVFVFLRVTNSVVAQPEDYYLVRSAAY